MRESGRTVTTPNPEVVKALEELRTTLINHLGEGEAYPSAEQLRKIIDQEADKLKARYFEPPKPRALKEAVEI